MNDENISTKTQFTTPEDKIPSHFVISKESFSNIVSNTLFKKTFNYLPLAAILILSLLLRLLASQESLGYVHPDEVFQSLEMIHYRIYGEYGNGETIPWEYNSDYQYGGARSWFFVFLLVGVYRFVMLFGITDPITLIYFARLFLSLFSMITVVVAYLFAKEVFNKPVGLLSAFIIGTWWFFPFWASRTMTDSMSNDFLFLSIFLVYKVVKSDNLKKKITFSTIAGILIGLAFMIRFPAALMGLPLAITLIYKLLIDIFRRADNIVRVWLKKGKTSLPLLDKKEYFLSLSSLGGFCVGALLMILFQGLLDLFTWGSFLHSPINYYKYNIVEGYSSNHGVAPWYHYFGGFFTDFAYYFIFLFFALFIFGLVFKEKGKSKFFILSLMFYWLVIFSSIEHKEFRFIMTFLPLGIIFVANGIYKFSKLFRKKSLQYTVVAFFLIALSASSLYMAIVEKDYIWKWNSGICNAMYWVGQQEDSERIIVLHMVWYTGGYAYLDKNISITFIRAQYINPAQRLNSSSLLEMYEQEGTYVVVQKSDMQMVKLLFFDMHQFFLDQGLIIVANIAGYSNAYVYRS